MPDLDTTAQAAVESQAFAPAWFIWLDINGDPLRITNFGQDVTFAGTGDADLDGYTFASFGGQLLDVGEISNSEKGSETLSITLSGIISMDAGLVGDVADKALWQGRTCRVWTRIYDETGVTPQGAIVALYTGYMSSVRFRGGPEQQAIELSVENYLAFFSEASNRSYLNQKDYDAADVSAAATIAASNGGKGRGGNVGSGNFFQDLARRGRAAS
jgi:hypothetical protein